jgi:hemin uptake protein HemP
MEAMTSRRLPPRSGEDRALPADSGQATEPVRRMPLSRILGGDREVVIEFNGADYHLRITRNEKLILTK